MEYHGTAPLWHTIQISEINIVLNNTILTIADTVQVVSEQLYHKVYEWKIVQHFLKTIKI